MAKAKNKYEKFEGFSDPESDRSILLDKRGARRTQSLFIDTNTTEDKYPSLYTMRDQDYKEMISAYQIYMYAIDEYDAALKLVGSIDHWNKLCGLKWFYEGTAQFTGIKQWRLDMKARDERAAKQALLMQVRNFNDSAAATKLANWEKTVKATVKTEEPVKPQGRGKSQPVDSKKSKIADLHKFVKSKQENNG